MNFEMWNGIGENVCCCKTEPFEGSENLQFKSVIENYDDYLNNKRFIERKRKECNDRQSAYQKQENENRKMLKNVFLNEFIGSEKQIKGLVSTKKATCLIRIIYISLTFVRITFMKEICTLLSYALVSEKKMRN